MNTKGLEWYLKQGGDPIEALLNYQYKERVGEMMCQAIKLEFPNISNLSYDADKEVISFDEGIYTKEQVEAFIDRFKQQVHDVSDNS